MKTEKENKHLVDEVDIFNRDNPNNGVIKIIAMHTREMAELQIKHATLMETHMEIIKKYQEKSIALDDLKSEILADLKLILEGRIAAPVLYDKYLGIKARLSF